MTVSLTLMLLGDDDEPRWVTDVLTGSTSAANWNRCCENGHYTPETAAHHGAELAVAALATAARSLGPETAGAVAINKLEPAHLNLREHKWLAWLSWCF